MWRGSDLAAVRPELSVLEEAQRREQQDRDHLGIRIVIL